MDINITEWLPHLVEAIAGGGLVALFTLPQKNRAARLENDNKLIHECYEHIEKLKQEMNDMETRYKKLIGEKDNEIGILRKRVEELEKQAQADGITRTQLENQVKELESQLAAIARKRNAKGQFISNK